MLYRHSSSRSDLSFKCLGPTHRASIQSKPSRTSSTKFAQLLSAQSSSTIIMLRILRTYMILFYIMQYMLYAHSTPIQSAQTGTLERSISIERSSTFFPSQIPMPRDQYRSRCSGCRSFSNRNTMSPNPSSNPTVIGSSRSGVARQVGKRRNNVTISRAVARRQGSRTSIWIALPPTPWHRTASSR